MRMLRLTLPISAVLLAIICSAASASTQAIARAAAAGPQELQSTTNAGNKDSGKKSTDDKRTSAARNQSPGELREIVVTGVLGSIIRSQQFKRDADSIVDSVSAEDLGKFTDQNVAEALERVPGVQIQRDNGGEGTLISVRGLGPELNRYLVNGQTAFSGNARAFDFSNIPAELVESVEVIKTPTADIDEGGLGAVVNIKTRQPLDLGDNKLVATLQDQYNQLSGRSGPRYSLLAGNTFADGTMGVLISGAHNDSPARQDYIEGFGWDPVTTAQFVNPNIAAPGAFRQTTVTPALDDGTRKRSALAGAFQWRPSDRFEANLNAMYTDLQDNHSRIQLTPQFQNTYPDNYSVYGGGITAVGVDSQNTINFLQAQNLNLTLQNLVIDNGTKTYNAGGNFVWHVGGWDVKGDAGFAKATQDNLFGNVVFGGRFDVQYDGRAGGVPNIAYYQSDYSNNNSINSASPVSINDPSVFGSQGVQGNLTLIDQNEKSVKFEADRAIDSSWLTKIQFGAGYRKSNYNNDFYIKNVFDLYAPNGAFQPFALSQHPGILAPFPVGNFANAVGGTFSRSWVNFDLNKALALMSVSPEVGSNFFGTLPYSSAGSFKIGENVASAYFRADFANELFGIPYVGNAGVRVASTKENSNGFGTNAAGTIIPVSVDSNYTDPLPSGNIKFKLQDHLDLRFAAARVITRPDYRDLNPGFVIQDVTNHTATAGNPHLKPFRATQVDASLEYYGPKGASAVVGLFYKHIDSFITHSTLPGALSGYSGTFEVTRPVNGAGAQIKGAEFAGNVPLALISDYLNGFGFNFGYTYVDSNATYVNGITNFVTPMEGLSKNSYTAGAYYQNHGLNLNLVYNWRSSYVYAAVGAESNTEYSSPQGYLYASASYDFDKYFAVTLTGFNLTNEKFQLYSDIPERMRFIAQTGRGAILGVRVKF